jgi:ribosome-associated protein
MEAESLADAVVAVENRGAIAWSLKLAEAAARAAADNRGQDIVLLDVSQQTSIFDFFLIVTGTSRRQLHAISEEIDRVLEQQFQEPRLSISGYEESRWIVLDYGGLVVHLFDEPTREYYDLEGLWADAQRVDLSEALKGTGATMARDS